MAGIKRDKVGRAYWPDTARIFTSGDTAWMKAYKDGYTIYIEAWKAFHATGVVCIPDNPHSSALLSGAWNQGFTDADDHCDWGFIKQKAA